MGKLELVARVTIVEERVTCWLAGFPGRVEAGSFQDLLVELPELITRHLNESRAHGTLEQEWSRLGGRGSLRSLMSARILFELPTLPVRPRLRLHADFDLVIGAGRAAPNRRDRNVMELAAPK